MEIATTNGFDPDIIPKKYLSQLRMEFIQEIVRDGANDASIKLRSEIMEAENTDPVLQFVMKMIVESWLISHGYRMIPDGSISASVRLEIEEQNRRKSAGVIKRVLEAISGAGQKTRTELIEQNEALATINEALKTDNSRLELDNAAIRTQAAGIINNASGKSVEIIGNATTKAESVLSKTRKECSKLVSDTETQARKILEEANSSKEVINSERIRLENILRRLTVEVEQKKAILVDLNSNPEIVKAYRNLNSSDSKLREEMDNQVVAIKYALQKLPEGYSQRSLSLEEKVKIISDLLRGYRDHILENLVSYEEKLGAKKRALLIPSLIMDLQQDVYATTNISLGNNIFSVTFFSGYLRSLIKENGSAGDLLRTFINTFTPLLVCEDGNIDNEILNAVLKKSFEISKPDK